MGLRLENYQSQGSSQGYTLLSFINILGIPMSKLNIYTSDLILRVNS